MLKMDWIGRGRPRGWRTRASGVLATAGLVAAIVIGCSDDSKDPMEPGTTTGRVSGAVLDNGTSAPIAGAAVTATSAGARGGPVVTDALGRFTIDGLAAGAAEVHVDARNVFPVLGNTDIHYPQFALHANVVGGQTATIDFPIFLPRIDETQATAVDGVNPATVTPPTIPGLEMDIAGGGATFPGGGTTGSVAIVEIPIDRAPMSMPPGMSPRLLISIQPAGATFDPPAPIRLPNREGLSPGEEADILSMDPVDGEFKLAARGQVTSDGLYIQSMAGTGEGGITAASWHAAICDEHTVVGRVVDSILGFPIVGARVDILSGVNSSTGSPVVVPGGTATTNASGMFTISGVRVCDLRIRVSVATTGGAGTTEVSGFESNFGGTTDVGDIEVSVKSGLVSFTLQGRVSLLDGTALPGARVDWFPNFSAAGERGLVTTTTDASGDYAFNGLVKEPEGMFYVSAFSEAADAYGDAGGFAPTIENNGSTVTADILACTFEEENLACPLANWALSGSDLVLSPADGTCNTFDVQMVLPILDFTNGVVMLENSNPARGGITLELGRVQGFGPSVLSTANLMGVYRETSSNLFVLLGAGGLFGFLEGDAPNRGIGPNVDYEAGTYSLAGSALTITPLYDSTGPPGPSGTGTASVNATTFEATFEGETEVFTRCLGTSGTSLPGIWIRTEQDLIRSLILIGATEYASASIDPPVTREVLNDWIRSFSAGRN